MALLAAYLISGKPQGMSLEDFLENKVFSGLAGSTIEPTQEEIDGFEVFTNHYRDALDVEKAAVEAVKW